MEEKYICECIRQAKKAFAKKNVPVGAVITKNNKIIAKAYNMKNSKNISIKHAEMIAIEKACKKLKTWILDECTMYVTLKPCKMCSAAIAESKIKNVVYLLDSNYSIIEESNHSKTKFIKCNIQTNYEDLLKVFFKSIR